MTSFPTPLAANRTIFARMTSRYGDVYLRARASKAARSSRVSVMRKGLRLGTSSDPLPRGTYHIGSASTMEIRHYNYEIRHLASDRLTRTGEKFSAFEASVSNHRNGRSAGHSPPRRLSQSQRSQRVHGWRPRLNASTNADDKALTKSSRTSGGNPGRHVHETVRNARDRRPFEHSERCCMVESFLTDRL